MIKELVNTESADLADLAYEIVARVCSNLNMMYGAEPYIVHLEEVAEKVLEVLEHLPVLPRGMNQYPGSVFAAALMHDLQEDTIMTKEIIEMIFGADVARMVDLVSDPEGPNRKERKRLLHERLGALKAKDPVNRGALLIKIADRYCNIERCAAEGDPKLKMYNDELGAFYAACYRPEMGLDSLWNEIHMMLHNGMEKLN